jgi:hypothetical protein
MSSLFLIALGVFESVFLKKDYVYCFSINQFQGAVP